MNKSAVIVFILAVSAMSIILAGYSGKPHINYAAALFSFGLALDLMMRG